MSEPVPPVAQRITVSLIPKASRELAELTVESGLSRSEVVNRAVSLYRFAQGEFAAGRELLVRDPGTDEVKKVHLL